MAAHKDTSNSMRSKQEVCRFFTGYWEPSSVKNNVDLQLPTISEVSEIFSAVNIRRSFSTSGIPETKSTNLVALRQSSKPSEQIAEKRHFSCILDKRMKKEDIQRVAKSASTHLSREPKRSASSFVSKATTRKNARANVVLAGSRLNAYASGNRLAKAKFVKAITISEKAPSGNQRRINPYSSVSTKMDDVSSSADTLSNSDEEEEQKEVEESLDINSASEVSLLDEVDTSMMKWREMSDQISDNVRDICKVDSGLARGFSVKTSCDNGSRHIWINIRAAALRNLITDPITVGEVKEKACRELKIDPDCIPIFGLYRGTLCDPTCLLADDEPVQKDDFCFCLMRAYFNPVDEKYIIGSDHNPVTELIYWELLSKLSSTCIFPPLSEESSVQLDDSSSKAIDSLPNCDRNQAKRSFLTTYWDLEFFQSYYYNKDSCYLKNSNLAEEWGVVEHSELIVALSGVGISIADKFEEKQLKSWPWSKVRSVALTTGEENHFIVEATGVIEDKEYIVRVDLKTVHSLYLFSIGDHIINLYRKRLEGQEAEEMRGGVSGVSEFNSKIFNKFGNLEERRKSKHSKILKELSDAKDTYVKPIPKKQVRKNWKKASTKSVLKMYT